MVAITSTKVDVEPHPILGPYMDAGRHPTALQGGTFSRIVGADGRFVGSLRPFPGCKRLTFGTGKNRLGDLISGATAFNFIKAITIQRGATVYELRGFVVRCLISAAYRLVFVYYDTSTSAWASYTINSTGTAVAETTKVDVTASGRFLYVAAEGITGFPRTVYWLSTDLTDKVMGPQFTALVAPDTPTEGTGLLPIGTYGVAYRFFDSVRNMYSGMSVVMLHTTVAATKNITFDITHPGGTPNDFDTLELFRTISVEVAGTTFDGGILYREKTVAMKATWTTGDWTGNSVGDTYKDEQLVQMPVYDPWADVAGAAPASGVICYYQGSNFMAAAPTESGGGGGFRWSATGVYAPEQFNGAYRYPGKLGDGTVIQMVEAGGLLYLLTSAVVYIIQKVGTQLGFSRFHSGRGLASVGAAHAVGNDLMMMTPLGIGVINGADLQIFSQLDRVIYEDWVGHLDAVVSAPDAYMGASFWVNTYLQKAIVIWHVTKTATLLDHCPFIGATSMPHPTAGGAPRAFFTTSDGVVVYPDAEVTGNHTMMTIAGTLNGMVTTASASALVDSAATFGTSDASGMIGAYVYMVTGSHAGSFYRITANTNTTTLAAAFGTTTAVGDRYAISPVPFELVLPPIKSTTDQVPDFERRIFKGIQIYATGHAGITANPNAKWKVGAYRENGSTLADSKEITMEDGAVAGMPGSTAPGSIDGLVVEPYVGCSAAGVNWELTSIEIMRTISKGRSLS